MTYRQTIGCFSSPGQSRIRNFKIFQTKQYSLMQLFILSFLLIHNPGNESLNPKTRPDPHPHKGRQQPHQHQSNNGLDHNLFLNLWSSQSQSLNLPSVNPNPCNHHSNNPTRVSEAIQGNETRTLWSMAPLSWSYSSSSTNPLCHALFGNRKLGYKVAFWNCRKKLINETPNDTNKLVDIKNFLNEKKPHVFGVIESDLYSPRANTNRQTRHTTDEVQEKLKIQGYTLLLPDTWAEHGQARVVAYVSDQVNFKTKSTVDEIKDLPNITIEVGIGKERKTIVNLFYREYTSGVSGLKNQASQVDRLKRQIRYWQTLYDENKDVLICGDANVDALRWNEDDYEYNKKVLGNMIQDQLLENSSTQIVKEHTRSETYGDRVSRSCIDHIYSNSPQKCSKPLLISGGDSDHLAVFVTKYCREMKSKPHTCLKRSYKHFNIELFLNDVYHSSINNLVQSCADLESAARTFQVEFSKIVNKHAPVKVFQNHCNYLPFLSDETKLLMQERDALKEEATKHSDVNLMAEYKIKRNEVKSRLKAEETEYFRHKFHDNKMSIKNVWKTVYGILGKQENRAPSCIRKDGKVITDPKTLATTFNKIFQNKVRKLRNLTTTNPKVDPSDRLKAWLDSKGAVIPNFSLEPINVLKLRKVLKKIKPSRSHGIDFIDAHSIKLAAPLIEDSLLHIINLSITTGCFATSWKTQLVLPLFKKNDRLDGTNYRPVAHIVELGKIVEGVVHDQVYNHFVQHDLFHGNHHGFLGNHSTATALAHLQDLWLAASEEKELSAALLLDLSAAFDIVDHSILLEKLKIYKFSDQTQAWFSSYLRDRKQVIQVESKYSDPEDLAEHGVPQGSILGPLIFIIFNNDFPASTIDGVSVLYADDDTVSVRDDNPEELKKKIQKEAQRSTEWAADNRMVCSGEKTKLLIIGTSQLRKSKLVDKDIKISIEVCGQIVEETRSEKLLGLVVNNQNTWKEYLYGEQWRMKDNASGLIPQLSQRVGLLRKIVHLMPRERFNTISQGLFYSKLIYCLQVIGNVWGLSANDETNRRYTAFTKEDNRKLQTLQNQVLRLKTGLSRYTPTPTLLSASGFR